MITTSRRSSFWWKSPALLAATNSWNPPYFWTKDFLVLTSDSMSTPIQEKRQTPPLTACVASFANSHGHLQPVMGPFVTKVSILPWLPAAATVANSAMPKPLHQGSCSCQVGRNETSFILPSIRATVSPQPGGFEVKSSPPGNVQSPLRQLLPLATMFTQSLNCWSQEQWVCDCLM